MSAGTWVTKVLKNEARLLVRFLKFEGYRRCIKCAIETMHAKYECENGNNHYFCKDCGQHN